jgi:hypothetical protein
LKKVKRKYFAAYGSHISVDKMSLVCSESYAFGWGSLQDFELEFKTLENIKGSKGCNVPVVLWSITEEDEMELDAYIDLDLYRKETIKVTLTDVNDEVAPYSANYYKEGIEALVYIMKDEKVNPEKAPSLEYYQSILEGYQQNNIDPEPLAKAVILAEGKLE